MDALFSKRDRIAHVIASGVVLCAFLQGIAAAGQTYDETIYVGPSTGSPTSSTIGSKANPYPTIDEAVQYAVYVNKRNSRNTQILVAPGTYRESINLVTYTNIEGNQPLNNSLITVEAEIPQERPIVSGSDVWTDWTPAGELYTHHWPYDWGLTDVRFGNNELEDIVKRREMIFLNGARLTPVDTLSSLFPGSFYVDETIDSVYVYPENSLDLNAALVEVSTRPTTWQQEFENNVTIRGIVFQHANDEWLDGSASIRISSSHGLTIDDCDFRHNNWTGLYIGRSDSVTVRASRMNDNGGRGMAVWRLRHARFEDSETSGNNWRGFLGAFTGWTVGNNVDSSHDITFIRHTASNNYARGLWFDTDVQDAVIEASLFYNNRNDGLFIEATQGPISIRHSYVVENGRDGLFTGAAEQLTLEHNNFRDNFRSAIRVSGSIGGREIRDFETDSVQIVDTRWWTMTNNRFTGSGPFMMGTTVDQQTWDTFVSTLVSDNNDWCHPAQGAIFQVPGGILNTLAQWRSETGQDINSTYCNPALGNDSKPSARNEIDVDVFPNPIKHTGRVIVRSEYLTEHSVEIFDSIGRLVQSGFSDSSTQSEYEVNSSEFASGLYFIVVRAGDQIKRRNLTIVK